MQSNKHNRTPFMTQTKRIFNNGPKRQTFEELATVHDVYVFGKFLYRQGARIK